MNLITTNEAQQLIQMDGDELSTTSLLIAEKFGKRHDTVLRSIRNLECSAGFRLRNFAESSYVNEQGKDQPVYTVTRDGFAFLAMGFTGKTAALWKERFIGAFNLMVRLLSQQTAHRATTEWLESRASGKVVRLTETDTIQDFIAYAVAQGSQNAQNYYRQITKMEYRALFLIDKAVGDGFRDKLNAMQLMNLATAESVAQRALRDGMAQELHYKDIYQLAKERVHSLANLVGKSLPGERIKRLVA